VVTSDRERYLAGREMTAAGKTADLANRVAELRSVLVTGVGRPARVDLRLLRKEAWTPPLDLGDLAEPRRAPSWQDFDPGPGPAFGHHRRLARARVVFDEAVRRHEAEEAARRRQVAELRERHDGEWEWARKAVAEHNRDLDEFGRGLARRAPAAVERYLRLVLALLPLPSGFPRHAEVAFHPETGAASVRVELPPRDVVPLVRAFTFDRDQDAELPDPRPEAEVRELYRSVIGQVVLLVARDLVDADEHLTAVAVDGHVRVAGHPRLIRLVAKRAALERISLRKIPPAVCLRRLDAEVSPAPYDYAAVGPPDVEGMLSP
jgi:restriction system protein